MRPLDVASLATICDSFFLRIFIRRRTLTLTRTVTLTSFFHAEPASLSAQGARAVLDCTRALNFRNSYFDQSAEVWSDEGQLLASPHQMLHHKN